MLSHPNESIDNVHVLDLHKISTVHEKIRRDQRGSNITIDEHKKMQKKMRKRTDSSNRDLLSQAINHNNNTKSGGLLSVINQAKKHELDIAHNDLIHTIHSFDRALTKSGSALKVYVMVGFKIKQVLRIDHIHLTFYANFNLLVEWNDPRLVDADPNNVQWNDADKNYFDPKINCVNGTDIETYSEKKELINSKTGLVKQTLSMRGNLTIHETSFGAFPFDYQDLRIQIKSDKYPGHSVLLVCHGTSMIEHHPREEWMLSGLRTEVYTTNPKSDSDNNSYSTMHIVIMVERDPTWYKRNILYTLSLIWGAAMVTLFMPFSSYDALGYRMESAIALLLASVATKFTVTEHLPKVSVLTLCEAHMTTCFLGICFNIFTSIFLYVIEKYAHPESVQESMSDQTRFDTRTNFYGGQPCAYGTMVAAHSIALFTIVLFVVWHIYIVVLAQTYTRRRDNWRTLALPESLELCGRPLPSILTQFNGNDTAIAKARDHLLSKFGNHLHHRSSTAQLSPSSSSRGSKTNVVGGEVVKVKKKKSGSIFDGTGSSMYHVHHVPSQQELIQQHSVNGLL